MPIPPSAFALKEEIHGYKPPPKDEEKPYEQYLSAMKRYELCEKTPLPKEAFGENPATRDSVTAPADE